MPAANMPTDESARVEALWRLRMLDSAPEKEFDALVAVAAIICGVPISLVSLVDSDRQWFKANVGLPGVTETPRDEAFCAHAILQDGIFEVPDAHVDPRFAGNPLVTAAPKIRFYAGATLRLSSGAHVGTLCVIDRVPRRLNDQQREALRLLSVAAVQALESRYLALELHESQTRFATLSNAAPLGVFATDAQGQCNYTNARWQEIYGLSMADALGNGWSRTLHPHDRDAVFAEWQRTAELQTNFDMEFRILAADGAVRCVRSISGPFTNSDGLVAGYVGSVEDVTLRKQQQVQLAFERDMLNRTGVLAKVGGWELDVTTGHLMWSDQTCRIHGLEPGYKPQLAEAIYFYAPEARPVIEAAVSRAMQDGTGWDLELPFTPRSGERIWVRAVGNAEFSDGKPVKLVGAFQDITERVLARQALDAAQAHLAGQHELLRVTLQSIGDAVITTDAQSSITWMNPVAERMTGWLCTEALGRPLAQVFHIVNETTRILVEHPVAVCLQQNAIVGLAHQTLLISRNGEEFGIEDSAAPIRKPDGEVLGVVLVFHDVTEQRRLSGEMSFRATHDPLTGLVNRAEFEARLRRCLDKSHSDGATHALLYIDLDQFKLVNDACGHAVGDQLLQQVAKLLKEAVRARDTLARLGGDEFGVILEQCSTEQADRVAQQICDSMESFRFLHDERRFRIGASIGLVPVDNRWANTAAVLQAADTSCYSAKEAGRNRVHAWFDTDRAMQARQGEMQWASRLEQALDENRFVLYAQRIEHNFPGEAGLHAEVLIRLLDNDGSLIAPNAFLPAAERFHMATRIDRWVLTAALKHIEMLPDLSVLGTLCVNLSGQSVGDRAFHRFALDALAAAGPAVCRRVCLEITETAAVTNMADAVVFIEQARALGVRIALDDFGAGASSFGYLKTLKVDVLKIDGSFIKDLIDDPLDDAAVRCFVDVARLVGVRTIAEFVSTAAILARVCEIGIHSSQGYLLHKPEPIGLVLGVLSQASTVDFSSPA